MTLSMNNSELDQLSIYLPYDLLLFRKGDRPESLMFPDYDEVRVMNTIALVSCVRYNNIKPMLLPMDCITREELEQEGFSTHIDALTWEWQKYKHRRDIGEIPYMMVKYLLSKHYDINNLIEQGLAIDKRTIKITPTDEH